MKFAATFTALSVFAASAVAQSIQIAQPPNFITCQPGRISWTGGTAPFFLSILPGGPGNTAATPLVDLGQQDSNIYVWNANVQPGQDITVRISDSQGIVQYSSSIPVIAGSSTDCVGQPISGTSAGSTVAGTSTGSAASSAVATTSADSSAAATSAGGVVGGVTSGASSVATAASSAVSSAASSASSVASSVASSASSVASSVVRTSTASVTNTATVTTGSAAAASSTPANAASAQSIGGVGAMVVGAIGAVVALF